MNKITSLDGLRGLAALLVLIDHAFLAALDLSGNDQGIVFYILSFIGSFAVGVFFILSGFVIFASIGNDTTASFLAKRAFRLYPVIIVSTLITYIVQIKYGKFVFDAESLKNLILNMSLFGGAFIYNESLALQIVWTLSIEVQFYLIAAMILSVTKGNVDKYIYYIIALLMVVFIAISIHVLKMADSPFKVYIGVGSSILPFMFIGTSICMLKKKAINKMQFTGLMLLIILAISYTPYPVYYSIDKGLPSFILAIIIFCLCLEYKPMSDIMSKKPMLFLGKISYPLYAIHMSILIFAYYSRDTIGGSGVFIEIMILSLIMAYIIHVTVESPIHEWSKRKVKNKYLLKS